MGRPPRDCPVAARAAGLAGPPRSSLKALTRRHYSTVTEGHPEWREGLPDVERVVDRCQAQ